jgi:hypothetical protein
MQIANRVVLKYAKEKFDLELQVEIINWESVTLFKEEIDTDMIPSDDLAKLKGDQLTILTASFEDREGNSYIFGLVIEVSDEENFNIEYAVCLKEDKLFESNINWVQLLN